MRLDYESDTPIFAQIAEGIKDAVLSGAFTEETQVPSITDFSVQYKINPATVLKGINMLVDEEILYKKRGIGMFVSTGAKAMLTAARKGAFYERFISGMIDEAKRLGISRAELEEMLEKYWKGDTQNER